MIFNKIGKQFFSFNYPITSNILPTKFLDFCILSERKREKDRNFNSKMKIFLLQMFKTGQYRIQDLDKVMWTLHQAFGKIAKVGGLVGHPDLLFVFDGDEIRKIFKKEEVLPHRCVLR